MKLPPGYAEIQGELVAPDVVCKLHKSIYGIKQHLGSVMEIIPFFVKGFDGKFLVVVVFVVDILIASTDDDALIELIINLVLLST